MITIYWYIVKVEGAKAIVKFWQKSDRSDLIQTTVRVAPGDENLRNKIKHLTNIDNFKLEHKWL